MRRPELYCNSALTAEDKVDYTCKIPTNSHYGCEGLGINRVDAEISASVMATEYFHRVLMGQSCFEARQRTSIAMKSVLTGGPVENAFVSVFAGSVPDRCTTVEEGSSMEMNRKTKSVTKTYVYGKTRLSLVRGQEVDPHSSISAYEAKGYIPTGSTSVCTCPRAGSEVRGRWYSLHAPQQSLRKAVIWRPI